MSDVSETKANAATTATFVTSLALNFITAGVQLIAFIGLRGFYRAVVDQAKPLGKNPFKPLISIFTARSSIILEKNGVDPYVFVRFLRMMAKSFVPIWAISWVVLMPINSVHTENGNSGVDRYTFGNVTSKEAKRYWAHLILTWGFNIWLMFNIFREYKHWLKIRQSYLINPKHSRLAQASTVLITGIPKHYMDETALEALFSHLPGGVRRIWLNRDLKEMPELYDRRTTATNTLESAQVNLIRIARDRQIKAKAKITKLEAKGKSVPGALHRAANGIPEGDHDENQSLADQLVPRESRPTMRLKPSWAPFGLGFLGIGEKVDTIEWARKEVAVCNRELSASRKKMAEDIETPGIGEEETYPPLSSAFIHFNQQIAAHMARQCVSYSQPYEMNRRFIEQSPENVIWGNMSLGSYEVKIRTIVSYVATVGLILAYAPVTAFIGLLSNITSLTDAYPWLGWLKWLEGANFGQVLLKGLVTGVLPPVLLAVFMMILPIFLRLFSRLQGTVSKTEVELDLMNRYFILLVIHTFFVVTISSGLVAAAQEIAANPLSVPQTLANKMPRASTFFITYILTKPVSLLLYYVAVILGSGTPRSFFNNRYKMPTVDYGSEFPPITVYCVIMIAYMVISPIMNGFGAGFFLLAYAVYKYLFIWVTNQPTQTDTGGLFFPKAVTHLFVGLYIQELCLTALFFLSKALPQAILMIILIVVTGLFQIWLTTAYRPLIQSLPLSLAHLCYGMKDGKGASLPGVGKHEDCDHEIDPRMSMTEEPLNASVDTPPKSPNRPVPPPQRPDIGALRWNSGVGKWEDGYAASRMPYLDDKEPAYELEEIRLDSKTPSMVNVRTRKSSTSSAKASLPPPEVEVSHFDNSDEVERGRNGVASGDPYEVKEDNTSAAERDDEDSEQQYFAAPGGPGVRPEIVNDGSDPAAFFHPATKEPQRIVWLPRDGLGLGPAEVAVNCAAGVKSTTKNAIFNHNGKIKVIGPPPDWL